jgi:hypothetical protein
LEGFDKLGVNEIEIETEIQLEELLLNNPEFIEEGFRLLANQKRTTPYQKRIDLLGVDSTGTLTILELKVKEDRDQLPQAIEYFDWLLERGISFFRDYFSELKIANKAPRIILVAPKYGERTIKLGKYISEEIDLSFKKYFAFDVEGKTIIKLVDENIPSKIEIEQPPLDENDLLEIIKNKKIKELYSETVDILKNIDDGKVRISLLSHRINFIHKSSGLKFAMIRPRQQWLNIYWKESDGFYYESIKTKKERDEIVTVYIPKALEMVKK